MTSLFVFCLKICFSLQSLSASTTISAIGISRTLHVVFVSPTIVTRLLTFPSLSNFGSCVIACSTFNDLFSKSTFSHLSARASPMRRPENIKQMQSGLIKLASSLFNASRNSILTSGGNALYLSFLLCALSFVLT